MNYLSEKYGRIEHKGNENVAFVADIFASKRHWRCLNFRFIEPRSIDP